MQDPTRRFPLLAVLFILFGGVVGGLMGNRVQAEAKAVAGDELDTFGEMLAIVESEYVGEIDSEELMENAIDGLLAVLDPHSNFLPVEAFSEMRDEQRGKFHGLGIQITKRGPDKPLTIIAPIDDTPASRAGLQSGDVISRIEGEPTIDLTVQQAVRLLKGDRGTKVVVTIQRPGLKEPFEVTIERDVIPIESVRVAYMVNPDVGVVRVSNFNTTTAHELERAVDNLRAQGMSRLILDLRSNPGGLLEQAVQVSSHFLPQGKLLVYTRGRTSGSNQDFVSEGRNALIDLPLIVLVDRSSASASEIVAGAIQDHDRGLVVGEATFGKGLVQRVIPLRTVRNRAAVAVTTAKYYTPSGRLIQRDYSDLDEYYLSNRRDPDSLDVPDNEIDLDDREIFYTSAGRKVYGGGGIMPDYIVDTPPMGELLLNLRRNNVIFDFAVEYLHSHPELSRDFAIDAPLIDAFTAFLRGRDFEFTDEAFEQERDPISLRIKAQIARIKWDQAAESRVMAEGDVQLQRALELFEEAARLALQAGTLVLPQSDTDSSPAELRAES